MDTINLELLVNYLSLLKTYKFIKNILKERLSLFNKKKMVVKIIYIVEDIDFYSKISKIIHNILYRSIHK